MTVPPVPEGMEKTYNPVPLEEKWRNFWLENEKFKSLKTDKGGKPVFSVVMPPPNVTGSLHIGHALNNTLQDVLVRYKKMKGFDVLWVPGTDHAGIATQMIVERELAKEGIERESIGKENFIEKVWEFKEKSGDKIFEQIRRLGFIPDWSKQRFTMDDGFSDAVKDVFVELYKQKFIRRDYRLVNYDPKLKTAISDLEVEQKEVQGHYWHIKYPLKDGDGHITVATTRPETMFGDVAVAVHPSDDRYKDLVGTEVDLPLTGRSVPVIADEYSDPEKGSGAVKITPAHDFNDFEVGKRHNLSPVNIFDENTCLNENAPEKYRTLDRFEARKKLVKDLEEGGFLQKTQNISHTVPYGDRSGAVIEPRLMEQWYMDVKSFAGQAVRAVEKDEMKFYPKFWERTYFQWMKNIEPWCISRQLWWGHQIPAWYGPDGEVFVEKDGKKAAESSFRHYGEKVEITRDPNVLDTWFSSALWPFVTLNWGREDDRLFQTYYPTTVLITGFDIIFFWVARMAMFGLQFTGKSPFGDICIHGLIRDEKGEKMSKTKGNVIDPLEIADQFGADALRFCLCALTSGGKDIELSLSTIRGYRNFMNKIWNAARFILEIDEKPGRFDKCGEGVIPSAKLSRSDKWILASLKQCLKNIDEYMEEYEFGKAAREIYRFFRRDFCDRYIESAKISIYGENPEKARETGHVLMYVLSVSAHALHPFCPHITEEINERIKIFSGAEAVSLLDSNYPEFDENVPESFDSEYNEMKFLFEGLIDEIRIKRGAAEIKVSEKIKVSFFPEPGENSERIKSLIESEISILKKLAGISSHHFCEDEKEFSSAKGFSLSVSFVITKKEIPGRLNINLKIEPEKKERNLSAGNADAIERQIREISEKISACEHKLANPDFTNKAPDKIIQKERGKLEEFLLRKTVLKSEMKRIAGDTE